VIARRDERDVLADALDDSGALVAEHGRRVARRVGARGRVEVGVADTAGHEPHQRLAGARLLEIELLHDERRPELLEHCATDLHSRRPYPLPCRAGRSTRVA